MKRLLPLCITAFAAILGNAQSFHNPRIIPLGVDPVSVTVGDINGDGLPDIVYGTGLYNAAVLHPLLAQANGTYTPGTDIVLPTNISSRCRLVHVTTGPNLDLLCGGFTQYGRHTAVLPGNGDGTFRTPIITTISAAQTSDASLTVAATADLNGDGFLDAIISDVNGLNVIVLLGDGTGNFTPRLSNGSGGAPTLVTLADLNGDGKLDMLEEGVNGIVTVFLGHGDGTFTLNQTLRGFNSGILADADGDGHADLIGGPSGTLQILHGNPDGTFNTTPIASVDYAGGAPAKAGWGSYIGTLAFVDVNGDGIPDVLADADDGFTVILGQPGLKFAAPVHYPVGQSFFNSNYYNAHSNLLVDLDGDGHLDFVAAGPNGLYITYGKADGTFVSGSVYETGALVDFSAVADFNGDGFPDVVTSGDTLLNIRLGNGDGTFRPSTALPTTGPVTFSDFATRFDSHLVSGDFNGDGKQDILAVGSPSTYEYHLYLFNGHGDGTFDAPVLAPIDITANVFISFFATVDINKDGKDDLAVFDNSSKLTIYLSQGNNSFTPVATSFPTGCTFPVFVDLNHTGHLDAVCTADTHVYILPGHGDGTFGAASTLDVPSIPGAYGQIPSALTVGDFDGDGKTDIAVLFAWFHSVYDQIEYPTELFTYYAQPGGGFSSAVATATSFHSFQRLQAADLDNDGRSDLVFDNGGDIYAPLANGQVIGIMHGRADRTFTGEANYVAGTGISSLSLVDLNHDGALDILAANGDLNATSNSFTVLLSGAAIPTVTGTLVASPEPSIAGQPFDITATLAPPAGFGIQSLTGSVSFAVDGVSVGTAPLTSNVARVTVSSPLAIGAHQLTATWPGSFAAGTTLAPLALAGTHVVTSRPVTLSISANPTNPIIGQPVTFTVSIADAGPTPSVPLNGTIQVTNGATQVISLTVLPLPGSGTFTFTYTPTTGGSQTFTATWPGDTAHSSATASTSLDIQLLQPTITVTGTPNPSIYGQAITFSVKVSGGTSGLVPSGTLLLVGPFGATIRFTLDSTGAGSYVAPPPGNPNAVPEAAGTLPLIPQYLGDTHFAATTGTTYIQTILPAPSATALTVAPTTAYQLQTVTFTATVTGVVSPSIDPFGNLIPPVSFYPTGPVQFYEGATLIGTGTLVNGQATLPVTTFSVGTHSIIARYPATSNLAGSASSAVTVTILPSDFSVDFAPAAPSLRTGHHMNLTLTLTSIGAFADNVTLSVGSLPPYGTFTFQPGQLTLSGGGKTTATIYLDTNQLPGFLDGHSVPSNNPWGNTRSITLALSPMVLLLLRRKRRRIPAVLALLPLSFLLLFASGCGANKYPFSTAPGTYTIHVMAQGLNTGVGHSTDLTLTVTP